MSAVPAALIAFAKAPETAKRRLARAIGRPAATAIAAALLADVLERGHESALAPRALYWDGPRPHPALAMARASGFAIERQAGGDLGARMTQAFAEALTANTAALLIGSDCPDLDARQLRQAAASLMHHDGVLIPAQDGGYVLVGLHRSARAHLPELFGTVRWGTSEVAAITRERFGAAGLSLAQFPALEDLDRASDLRRLARRHPFLTAALREKKSA